MNRNPFLKAEQRINRSVYNNRATLHLVVRRSSFDAYTGEVVRDDFDFVREIHLGDPKTLSDFILSSGEYRSGDLNVDVAYQEFLDAIAEVREDDPEVLEDGISMTLSQLRSRLVSDGAYSGGLDTTTDWLEFAGKRWRFVKMVPRTFWANTPSAVRVHLREAPPDA